MHQELIINRLKLLDGNLERINPNLPLEDQVNLLPYDNKYEFPSSNLVLTLNEIKENHLLILTMYLFKKGKQLGTGQFGRVVQAKAVGMGQGNSKVAVKMVKLRWTTLG
jgi:FMS-like tyrosine kinase 1